MAGYSGTPLPQKIGIKPGHRISLLNAPADLSSLLAGNIEGVQAVGPSAKSADVILIFEKSRTKLEAQLSKLISRIAPDGMLWVAWPKKASGVETDITENLVRDTALPLGLVDVKVCAIDDTWSGLKLVIRKENRAKAAGKRT